MIFPTTKTERLPRLWTRETRRRYWDLQCLAQSPTSGPVSEPRRKADWGPTRRQQLESALQTITVIPVSDGLLTTIAELRFACHAAGHPLHEHAHANDLWIAASALHIDAPLLTADKVFDRAPGLNHLR